MPKTYILHTKGDIKGLYSNLKVAFTTVEFNVGPLGISRMYSYSMVVSFIKQHGYFSFDSSIYGTVTIAKREIHKTPAPHNTLL